jgi:hypothetical protein
MHKILFLCKDRASYGEEYSPTYGLFNSATFISNYLNFSGFESKVEIVTDGNSIDKAVTDYKPEVVIIEALWVTPNKFRELLKIHRHKKVLWVVRLHSKIPFLAHEGIAFPWLLEYKKIQEHFSNFKVSVNNLETSNDLEKVFNLECIYLPNIYYPKNKKQHSKHHHKNHVDIGCFGSIRPMKNQLIQAVASIEYGDDIDKDIHFHINVNRIEQHGDNVYKNLKALFHGSRHKLVEHLWMKHDEFIELVITMDLGLQVSLSETFNIVAADFIWNSIPFIGSKDIEWMPSIFKANPNSSEDIAKKMNLIMDTRSLGLYKINNLFLMWYNFNSENIWEKFLN